MKRSKLSLFAFRPAHYCQMEQYLNKMLASGWKLRWCRGIFAEFEPVENENLMYAVDPYAMTSLTNFRRYPKLRSNLLMQAGWHSVGRSKGCQIFCSPDPDAAHPVPEQEDLVPLIRSTCRLGSMLNVLLILLLGWFLLSKKAIVYGMLLRNLYLVLAAVLLFLLVFHGVNAVLETLPHKTPKNPRICKRYLLHSGAMLLFLIAAAVLELGGRNDMMLYLMIPIVTVFASILLMKTMRGNGNARRMNLVVIALSLVLFVMIVAINQKMNLANTSWATQKQEQLLEQVDELPVLRLDDFGESGEVQAAAQERRSVLGHSVLYAEQSNMGYLFTNNITMKAPVLADRMFQYLYEQGQKDFGEEFQETICSAGPLYVLNRANTALLQNGSSVYFITVPEGQNLVGSMELLLEKNNPTLKLENSYEHNIS